MEIDAHRTDDAERTFGAAMTIARELATADVVLVHDAVRPFVDIDIINAVIEAASRVGAAIAGLPAVDTVKQVERTAEFNRYALDFLRG